jgi:TonB family protein
MFPQRISRSALRPDESLPDPLRTLEQHIFADFPPDLALDLILNEIVVRAAEATHASASALALIRGGDEDGEMVCRAATGDMAPGLGIPLKPRDGLSGACLQSRRPQLCVDTECDPRVDPDLSRRLGIRSVLAVPIFETNETFDTKSPKFMGVLEVFSTSPSAFSSSDQKLLEGFAEECARVRQAALELGNPVDAPPHAFVLPRLVSSDFTSPDFNHSLLPVRRSPYETWALALGALTILVTVTFGLLIGARLGWLGTVRPAASGHIERPVPVSQRSAQAAAPHLPQSSSDKSSSDKASSEKTRGKPPRKELEKVSKQISPTPAPASGDLVVYEKGKLVFRMKSSSTKAIDSSVTEAASTAKLAPTTGARIPSVWLDPDQAESRLVTRTEPVYPDVALAARQAGDVVLEVQVAEDGKVSHTRLLSGNPVLAAAASEAVRTWRYQPYLRQNHASPFETEVTLRFTLPN